MFLITCHIVLSDWFRRICRLFDRSCIYFYRRFTVASVININFCNIIFACFEPCQFCADCNVFCRAFDCQTLIACPCFCNFYGIVVCSAPNVCIHFVAVCIRVESRIFHWCRLTEVYCIGCRHFFSVSHDYVSCFCFCFKRDLSVWNRNRDRFSTSLIWQLIHCKISCKSVRHIPCRCSAFQIVVIQFRLFRVAICPRKQIIEMIVCRT